MSVTSPDFESGAYTNFATPARIVGADAILIEATRSGQPLSRLPSFQPKTSNNLPKPAKIISKRMFAI